MLNYRSSVSIARPPAEVYPYLVEPARQALWSDVPMRRLGGPGPMSPGVRMEATFGSGLLKAVVGLEIAAVEQDRRLAFTSFSGPIRWQGEYHLEPDGSGGTTLSQEGTLAFSGLWRAMEPLIGAEISRGEVKELEKLKAVIEGGG